MNKELKGSAAGPHSHLDLIGHRRRESVGKVDTAENRDFRSIHVGD